MDRLCRCALPLFFALSSLLSNPASAQEPPAPVGPDSEVPQGARCLIEAYPDHLAGFEDGFLLWQDGTRMRYDDGRTKTDHDALLGEADLQDQMEMRYPAGKDYGGAMPKNFEPGRVRHEPFFRKMYGADQAGVRSRLRKIRWLPNYIGKPRVLATEVNGVADKLEKISKELETLARRKPKVAQCLRVFSGSFNWRKIRGTERQSVHSFGIAIDMHAKAPFGRYWKWGRRGKDGLLSYDNEFPLEIVEVFEKYGFVWGGKWYHFDTPHFEYRPELLQKGCVVRGKD